MKKQFFLGGVLMLTIFLIFDSNESKFKKESTPNVDYDKSIEEAAILHFGKRNRIESDSRSKGNIYFNPSYIDTVQLLEKISNNDISLIGNESWRGARRKAYFLFGQNLKAFKEGSNRKIYLSKKHRETSFLVKFEFDSLDFAKIYSDTPEESVKPYCVDSDIIKHEVFPYYSFNYSDSDGIPLANYACYKFGKSEEDSRTKWYIYLGYNYLHGDSKDGLIGYKGHVDGHVCDPRTGCND